MPPRVCEEIPNSEHDSGHLLGAHPFSNLPYSTLCCVPSVQRTRSIRCGSLVAKCMQYVLVAFVFGVRAVSVPCVSVCVCVHLPGRNIIYKMGKDTSDASYGVRCTRTMLTSLCVCVCRQRSALCSQTAVIFFVGLALPLHSRTTETRLSTGSRLVTGQDSHVCPLRCVCLSHASMHVLLWRIEHARFSGCRVKPNQPRTGR